jgi:hypothetical protein
MATSMEQLGQIRQIGWTTPRKIDRVSYGLLGKKQLEADDFWDGKNNEVLSVS